jgi:multidrug efflux system membrane fusion protein
VSALEAQIKGDQANIDNARTQLQYTTIDSPIEGRTGIRKVDVGNNIHATDTSGIVVVTQVQPITVIFTLPEEDLPRINKAMSEGTLQVSAFARDESTEFDRGKVMLVDNQIDQATGTMRLKAEFPNKNNALWPGQYVNARVLVSTVQNALTVPDAALQRGPDGLFAYVIKTDSTVEVRPLQVGQESAGIAVVQNGLREGERVATTNQYRLEPGAHVRIVEPASTTTELAKRGGPSLKP